MALADNFRIKSNYSRCQDQRDAEEFLIENCLSGCFDSSRAAGNEFEGNLFYLASDMLYTHYPEQSKVLLKKSNDYFKKHPEFQVNLDMAIFDYGVVTLPRFRATLVKYFYFKLRDLSLKLLN